MTNSFEGPQNSAESKEKQLGNLISKKELYLADKLLNTTEYTYDEKGKVTKEYSVYPDGTMRTDTDYIYDEKGNNIEIKYRGSSRPNYQSMYTINEKMKYDYAGNKIELIEKELSSEGEPLTTQTYKYKNEYTDEGLKTTRIKENDSLDKEEVHYQYDVNGKLLRKQVHRRNKLDDDTEYIYSDQGHLKQENSVNYYLPPRKRKPEIAKTNIEYILDEKGNPIKSVETNPWTKKTMTYSYNLTYKDK